MSNLSHDGSATLANAAQGLELVNNFRCRKNERRILSFWDILFWKTNGKANDLAAPEVCRRACTKGRAIHLLEVMPRGRTRSDGAANLGRMKPECGKTHFEYSIFHF